jgi:hypothetical protein
MNSNNILIDVEAIHLHAMWTVCYIIIYAGFIGCNHLKQWGIYSPSANNSIHLHMDYLYSKVSLDNYPISTLQKMWIKKKIQVFL